MKATSLPPPALRPGTFYGETHGRWSTGLVTLSVVEHAAPRQVPCHSHQHIFLSLLVRGGYQEWIGDQRIDYAPLTAVFHPEHLEHRDQITAAGSLFFIAEVDPSLLGDSERRRRGLASVRELGGGPPVWSMLRLFDAVGGARRDPLEAEEPVTEILDQLVGGAWTAASAPRWLGRVEALLRDGMREPMSLRSLADAAGVHPNHVARVFRRHHGCTMRSFLHRLRVLHASRRIAADAPLAEVALDSGFYDQSHLTHVFLAVTGMTPSAYRALLRGELAAPRRAVRLRAAAAT
jgi:AraC family transcriptional regulator